MMKKSIDKNLLIIIPTFYPHLEDGGPIISLYNQLYYLHKEINISVYTKTNTKKFLQSKKNNFINYEVYTKKNFFSLFFLIQLIKKNDIVHIHSIFSLFTIFSLIFSLLNRKKIILSPRGSITKDIKSKKFLKLIIIRFLKTISNKSLFYHVTSKVEHDDLSYFFKNKIIFLIPNGINHLDLMMKDKYHIKLKKNILKKSILYCSRIDRKKNLHLLVHYAKNNPDTNLIIIGEITDKKYFLKLNLDFNNIFFLGPIYNTQTLKYYFHNCSFLCLPSNSENFANVVLECLNNMTPVLISSEVGAKFIVKKYNVGLIFDLHKDNLEQYIELSFVNLEKHKKNIYEYKDTIINKFSWKSINNSYLSFLNKI